MDFSIREFQEAELRWTRRRPADVGGRDGDSPMGGDVEAVRFDGPPEAALTVTSNAHLAECTLASLPYIGSMIIRKATNTMC